MKKINQLKIVEWTVEIPSTTRKERKYFKDNIEPLYYGQHLEHNLITIWRKEIVGEGDWFLYSHNLIMRTKEIIKTYKQEFGFEEKYQKRTIIEDMIYQMGLFLEMLETIYYNLRAQRNVSFDNISTMLFKLGKISSLNQDLDLDLRLKYNVMYPDKTEYDIEVEEIEDVMENKVEIEKKIQEKLVRLKLYVEEIIIKEAEINESNRQEKLISDMYDVSAGWGAKNTQEFIKEVDESRELLEAKREKEIEARYDTSKYSDEQIREFERIRNAPKTFRYSEYEQGRRKKRQADLNGWTENKLTGEF